MSSTMGGDGTCTHIRLVEAARPFLTQRCLLYRISYSHYVHTEKNDNYRDASFLL